MSEQPQPNETPSGPARRPRRMRLAIRLLVVGALLFFLVTRWVLVTLIVPTPSMEPYLHGHEENGDRVGNWTWWHDNGKVLMEGMDYGELDEDGRIKLIVGFFGPFPPSNRLEAAPPPSEHHRPRPDPCHPSTEWT